MLLPHRTYYMLGVDRERPRSMNIPFSSPSLCRGIAEQTHQT